MFQILSIKLMTGDEVTYSTHSAFPVGHMTWPVRGFLTHYQVPTEAEKTNQDNDPSTGISLISRPPSGSSLRIFQERVWFICCRQIGNISGYTD